MRREDKIMSARATRYAAKWAYIRGKEELREASHYRDVKFTPVHVMISEETILAYDAGEKITGHCVACQKYTNNGVKVEGAKYLINYIPVCDKNCLTLALFMNGVA